MDVGVTHLAALSTGEKIENPRAFDKHCLLLGSAQQRLARQRQGSKRRANTKRRIARNHASIADCRREHLHCASTRLIDENQAIAIEDLNAKGMGASAKGTRQVPGTNVRAKSVLNRRVRGRGFRGAATPARLQSALACTAPSFRSTASTHRAGFGRAAGRETKRSRSANAAGPAGAAVPRTTAMSTRRKTSR